LSGFFINLKKLENGTKRFVKKYNKNALFYTTEPFSIYLPNNINIWRIPKSLKSRIN